MPNPPLELRASRLYGLWLLATFLAATGAALASQRDDTLAGALLAMVALALAAAWFDERRRGVRALRFLDGADGTSPQLELRLADGRVIRAPYAGHAILGTFAVFVFLGESGWRARLGPRRVTVLRDAVDADAFRRLRARVRLGY